METKTELNLETLAQWGQPQQVETKAGPRILRKAPADESFWTLWRTNKETLRAAGISCSQYNGKWEVCFWQHLDPIKAQEEREAKQDAIEKSRATEAAIEVPKPDGLNYLGYQKAGVQFASDCWRKGMGCLIGDEMGLGKTIQAIGLINSHPEIKKVIIVCPNTLKLNWARECRKWFTRKLSIAVQYSDRTYMGHDYDVLIINYDCLSKFADKLKETKWDLLVIDEGHYIKNPKAVRTKITLSIQAPRKATLTGTPITNRPVELWPLISDLNPKQWDPKKGFFQYAKRFCNAQRSRWGWDFSGHSNEAELQSLLRGSIMVRRLKCDVLTELPAKRRQVIELESDSLTQLVAAQSKATELAQDRLDSLRAKVEAALANENREDYEQAVHALREGQGALFAEMAKIRYETGTAKIPQALAFIEDSMENGKVVVFCHHLDVAAAVKAKFPQAAVITGQVDASERQAEVDRFQNDPACNIFIGNDAAAEGITLTASSHVIFIEGDWVPGKLAQKEDRTHRIGQKNAVLVSYLILEGTLDAHMLKVCVEKLNVIDQVLDKMPEQSKEASDAITAAQLIGSTFNGIGGVAKAVNTVTVKIETIDPEVRTAQASYEQVTKQAAEMPSETIKLIHYGLQIIAGMDRDHARDINGMGFSKTDTMFGCSLAEQASLTPRQAVIGLKLCRKYRRQLPAELVEKLGVGAKDQKD